MAPSCLTDPKVVIVCDASAIINLNATGCATTILKALPNPFAISDITLVELREDIRSNRNDAKLAAELETLGLIEIVSLDDAGSSHFERLVAGRTIDTLDDGEAATIACALVAGGAPIIDERKANRICRERYPKLHVGCTVDILAHEALITALGRAAVSEAMVHALQQARMRVLPHCLDWVVELIGPANANACPSLPSHVRGVAEGIR